MAEAESVDLDDYKQRYVAYLDLMGFKARVDAAENDPEARKELREILQIVRESLTTNPNLDFRLSYFSDCLLITAARTALALAEVFASVDVLTSNLIQYDVMVRGGLTAGLAQHGKVFLYGSAINRAVTLEQRCAKHPITLISQEVMDDATQYMDYFRPFIEQSDRGPFIHHLRRYRDYTPQPIYSGKVILDDPAGRIIDFIVERLNHDTGSPLEKAQWFAEYWNRTVASAGVFEKIDAASTHRYSSHGPMQLARRMVGASAPQLIPPAQGASPQARGQS